MKLSKILAGLLLIAFSVGCSTTPGAGSKSVLQSVSSLSTEQQKQYVNAKLLAESAVRQQQFDVASSNYLIAAQLINSTDFAEKAIHFAERSEDRIASLQAANFWNQIAPSNQNALAWKILGLLRSHQDTPLQKTLQHLLTVTRSNSPGQYLKIMETVIAKQANPHSFKQMEIFAKNNPNEPEGWLVLARLSELMDEKVTAIVLIDKALSVSPNFSPALELKGLIYLRSGKTADAKKHFTISIQNNPEDNALKLQLAQMFYQENNYQDSEKLALEIVNADATFKSARYLLAAVYFIQEKYDESEGQFLSLLEKNYKPNAVYYFLGEINLEYSKTDIALPFFDAVTTGRHLANARVNAAKILFEDGELVEALKRLRNVRTKIAREQIYLAATEIEMLQKSGKIDRYKNEIEQSFSRNPTNIFLFTRALKIAKNSLQRKQIVKASLTSAQSQPAYKALVEVAFSLISQAGDNLQAIELLNDYLIQFPTDLQLFYSRAMLKAAEDDITGMEQDLRSILKIDPSYVDALNALGYSLADQNRELDKAYEMISTAFRQRPYSGAITDSMGWVLYRKGELEDSLNHLEKAWDLDPSAEVGAHFGEVLWHSNAKEKAKQIWQHALQLDEDNKILLETLERLKVD